MDFIITKEQQRMQKAAREMLKAKCTNEFVWKMEKDAKRVHAGILAQNGGAGLDGANHSLRNMKGRRRIFRLGPDGESVAPGAPARFLNCRAGHPA